MWTDRSGTTERLEKCLALKGLFQESFDQMKVGSQRDGHLARGLFAL